MYIINSSQYVFHCSDSDSRFSMSSVSGDNARRKAVVSIVLDEDEIHQHQHLSDNSEQPTGLADFLNYKGTIK